MYHTLNRNRGHRNAIDRLLSDPAIDRAQRHGQTYYDAVALVAALTGSQFPQQVWDDTKQREPALTRLAESIEFAPDSTRDALDLSGVLRLIQAVNSPRAERLKRWLADAGRAQIDEMQNPELAFLRAQRLYRKRGYSRRWVDKRLRSVSTRQELASEWAHRGASDSAHFRELTNGLIQSAFGMDVQAYRQYKGLSRPTQKLRDHFSDLELALLALAEATATTLSRERNSKSMDALNADVRDAGLIVAQARHAIGRATQSEHGEQAPKAA